MADIPHSSPVTGDILKNDFEFQVLPYEDISSTNIRYELHDGIEQVQLELPEKVMEYIEKNELYKN